MNIRRVNEPHHAKPQKPTGPHEHRAEDGRLYLTRHEMRRSRCSPPDCARQAIVAHPMRTGTVPLTSLRTCGKPDGDRLHSVFPCANRSFRAAQTMEIGHVDSLEISCLQRRISREAMDQKRKKPDAS